ncbi:hypothetical protein [Kribbella sp. NPDC003557]|uniref:hypothetical protein n=1 Tax=Kribbella sp. NPDC003557 TaxID=3154449 RepID=UPI0033AAA26F
MPLTDQRTRLLRQDKATVQALLGRPARIGYWTTTTLPRNASAAMVAEFRAHTLDEIWIYPTGRVHFTLDGRAAKVDDKPSLDLPPAPNLV